MTQEGGEKRETSSVGFNHGYSRYFSLEPRHSEEAMKMFGDPVEGPMTALQLFEPDARTVYTIEAASSLAQVPRRVIVVYFKHGLVSPVVDPMCGGWYFNDEAIRILRRIEYLRTACGINLVGIKLIMDLVKEVEQLRDEVRFIGRRPRQTNRAL